MVSGCILFQHSDRHAAEQFHAACIHLEMAGSCIVLHVGSFLFGPSVIMGFQKTQIYQRFAGSRQEGFILKIQNDENNAAQQDNGRRFHI